jgi:hypothetical protein
VTALFSSSSRSLTFPLSLFIALGFISTVPLTGAGFSITAGGTDSDFSGSGASVITSKPSSAFLLDLCRTNLPVLKRPAVV